MSFTFTDQHITDYYHHHYTIFRSILPPRLVDGLRTAGEELRQLSAQLRGPEVARSPVLSQVTETLSAGALQTFADYCELPQLVDAMHRVLSQDHSMPGFDRFAVFFTYPVRPICQDWHRDIAEGYKGITEPADVDEFRRLKLNPTFFVQVNCALYTDTCLWFVPGSAGRPNTPSELAAAGPSYSGVEGRGKLIDSELDDKSYAEQERLCLEYCQAMPGAVNVVLEAGDFCLYRPLGWHNGNYAPHRKRLTLHHHLATPASLAWYTGFSERRA